MKLYIIEIENWKPPSLNSLMASHWRKAAKAKSATAQMIGIYAHKAGVPKATGKRFVKIEITQSGKGRPLDSDNMTKAVFDALTCTGYIKDDSQKWLEYSPPIIKRGTQTKTIITLTDL